MDTRRPLQKGLVFGSKNYAIYGHQREFSLLIRTKVVHLEHYIRKTSLVSVMLGGSAVLGR